MLFDYFDVPSAEDRKRLIEGSAILECMNLEILFKSNDNDINLFMRQIEFQNWLRAFNNRIGELYLTYIMLMHFYSKGIPDEEWYISPGRNGESTEYFPHFEEKHHGIKYFFDYFVSVFYYQLFSIWDSIPHLINVYYGFEINPDLKFLSKVMKKLETKNAVLYKLLFDLRQNEVYRKANKLRNDLTHNFTPTDIDSGIKRTTNENSRVISFGLGKYTRTREFKENIDQVLELLAISLKEIKNNLEQTEL